jgi:hypothetical protein
MHYGTNQGHEINYKQQGVCGEIYHQKQEAKLRSRGGSPNKLVLEIRAPQGVLKHFFASLAGSNAHKVAAQQPDIVAGGRAGGLKSGKLEIFSGAQ